jgi:heat shock protein HtpX
VETSVSISGSIGWFSWHHGSKRVLWSSGAWELITPVTFDQRQLINVVEEMSIASGLPKPTVWIVPDPDPNAFATGIDPNDAHIAVTEGLLRVLDRAELQGVVAHEMAHVRNFDVRLMTLLAAMVGVIALMSDGFGRLLQVRGGRMVIALMSDGLGRLLQVRGGRMPRVGRGGGARREGNPLAILVLVAWVLTLIIAPIVSRLIAMTVSRKREFLAVHRGPRRTPYRLT